jgi:hypothetical protein
MNPDQEKSLMKLFGKVLFSIVAILAAIALGPVVGVALLFYYAYLLLYDFARLKRIYKRVEESPLLVKLWDKIKSGFLGDE